MAGTFIQTTGHPVSTIFSCCKRRSIFSTLELPSGFSSCMCKGVRWAANLSDKHAGWICLALLWRSTVENLSLFTVSVNVDRAKWAFWTYPLTEFQVGWKMLETALAKQAPCCKHGRALMCTDPENPR